MVERGRGGEGGVWTRLSEWRTSEGRPVLMGAARVRTGEGEWEYQAAMDAGGVEVWVWLLYTADAADE